MGKPTVDVAIAAAVFFVVTFVWPNGQSLISTVFATLIFALSYAAVRAALVIFRSE